MPSRNADPSPRANLFPSFTVLIAAVLVLAGACIVLGWQARLPLILEFAPGVPDSSANAGMVFVFAGVALMVHCLQPTRQPQAPAARLSLALCACVVLAIGAIALVEYATGFDFGINRLLHAGGGPRMTIPAAVCAVLGGAALLMLERDCVVGRYPSEILALLMVAFMAVPMIGYLFDVTAMMQIVASQGVGPLTASMYILFGLGLLSARSTHRVTSIWNSEGPGGGLVRHLLPKSLLLLLILFLLVDRGARLHWYSYEKVLPLAFLLAGVWLSVLFVRAASMINREHEERQSREVALSETSRLLAAVSDTTPDAIYVKDRQGRMVFANPATSRMLGRPGEDLSGRDSRAVFLNPADAELVDSNDRAVMQAGQAQAMEETLHLADGVRTMYSTKAPWLDSAGRVQGVIGISTDITERKRVEDALREHETQLERLVKERTAEVSELIGHLESTREEEKRAIARELHDDLGSALTALSMHLAILFQKMPHDPVLMDRAQQVKSLLASVTKTTRRIQVGLRPDKLDIFGIKTAISELCLEFQNYSGVACRVDLPDEEVAYAPATEIGLYRMVQEGLNNVAKHARATQVEVILDDSEDGIVLSLRDNGVGFTLDSRGTRLTHGLRGMRERAQYLGGTVQIRSTPGKGTAIIISLPRTVANEDQAREAGQTG